MSEAIEVARCQFTYQMSCQVSVFTLTNKLRITRYIHDNVERMSTFKDKTFVTSVTQGVDN